MSDYKIAEELLIKVVEAELLIKGIDSVIASGVVHRDINGNSLLTTKDVLLALHRDGKIFLDTCT